MPKTKLFRRDTEENRLEDVRRDFKLIRHMDDLSTDVIKEALKSGGHRAIEYIGEDKMTTELYKFLIERYPNSFGNLNEIVRTPELCTLAVSLHGTNLRHITNKTQELCTLAMRTSSNSFQYVPTEFRNEEVYYLAVKSNVVNLRDIPSNSRSKRMCLTAVKQQSGNIESVPNRYKRNDFYMEVFERNKNIFKYMPNELKTEDVCLKALKEDRRFIEFIPKELQTDNICMDVLSSPHYKEYIRFITTDSPIIQKKIKRMKEREERMSKMFHGGFYHPKHHRDFYGFGMPPFDMFLEPVMDYVSECEDKIDDLTDMVESLKKEVEEMKKINPSTTEVQER